MKPSNASKRGSWKEYKELLSYSDLWIIFALAFALALTGNVAASSLYAFLTSMSHDQFLYLFLICLCAVIFAGLSFWLYARLFLFKTFHATLSDSGVNPKKSLTFLISTDESELLPDTLEIELKKGKETKRLTIKPSAWLDISRHANELGALWDSDKLRTPFEMILRGLANHREVERIYLIGSKTGNDGTDKGNTYDKLANKYCPFLKAYCRACGRDVEVLPFERAVNFEEPMDIYGAFKSIMESEKRARRNMEDFCIDVTGGQKPTSIAAAAVTLDSHLPVIQYVQTGGEKNAKHYNIVLLPTPPIQK